MYRSSLWKIRNIMVVIECNAFCCSCDVEVLHDVRCNMNCNMIIVMCPSGWCPSGCPNLCLFASRDIRAAEELRYDYGGGRSPRQKRLKQEFQLENDINQLTMMILLYQIVTLVPYIAKNQMRSTIL